MNRKLSSLFAGVIIGFICFGVAVLLWFILSPRTPSYSVVSPVVTVIPAPPIIDTPTPQLTAEPSATQQEGLPPDPGAALSVGMTVRVTGTGGDGLRLRREPGTSTTPIFLGAENEVFVIKSGPESVDGYTWWYLEAPYDSTRAGWAVANYLVEFNEQ
mgnify:CR=1 FL=1